MTIKIIIKMFNNPTNLFDVLISLDKSFNVSLNSPMAPLSGEAGVPERIPHDIILLKIIKLFSSSDIVCSTI